MELYFHSKPKDFYKINVTAREILILNKMIGEYIALAAQSEIYFSDEENSLAADIYEMGKKIDPDSKLLKHGL